MQEIFIKGFNETVAFPDDFSDKQISEAIERDIIPQFEREREERLREQEERRRKEEEENQGVIGRGADLFEQAGREYIGETSRGIGMIADMAGADGLENTLDTFADDVQEPTQDIRPIKPLTEAEGIGDVVNSTASYLTQMIPEMSAVAAAFYAGSKAGAGVGALAGTAIPIPGVGTVTGAGIGALVGGFTAGAGATYLAFTGRNVEEFKETQGRNPTLDEQVDILVTSGVQSSLNVVLQKLLFTKGSGRTITGAMVNKAAKGTGVEGLTEGLQEALSVAQANNYEDLAEVFSDPQVQARLKESALAGAVVGGTISGATAPFTTEIADPTGDQKNLEKAAQDFVDGRQPVEGIEQVKPLQITQQSTPQPEIPLPARPTAEAMLPTSPEPSLTPQQRAAEAQNEVIKQVLSEATQTGQDPLVALSDPKVARMVDDAIAMEQEQEAIIAPTAQALAPQNTSKMTNRQLIEFAQQNSKTDPVLSDIVNSEVPVPKKGDLIRRRLTELNVKPTTSLEQGQQVGNPILRKTSEIDEDGKIRRTATEDTVQETDVATQTRMSRRKDTPESDALKAEIGPVATRGLLEALKLRGGEASVRFTPDGLVDDKATLKQEQRNEGATNYLGLRLQGLRNRGEQGRKAADAIQSQVLNNQDVQANDIVGAFLAADAIVDTLGSEGANNGVDIRFMERLEKRNDAYGFKTYDDTVGGKSQAVIELALRGDTADGIRGTAAHEAFHVLQDFFASESPKDKKILDTFYKTKEDGTVDYKALPPTIKNLWKQHSRKVTDDSGRTVSYHDMAMAGVLPADMATPSEFQAMTYEYYKKAKAKGVANPLSGAMGGYFDFVSRFLPRLKNALNGMGYQTVEDVFVKAEQGKTGNRLKGKTLAPREMAPMTQVAEELGDEASQRDIFNAFRSALDNQEGVKDRVLSSEGGRVSFDIEYEAEAGPPSQLVEVGGMDATGVQFLETVFNHPQFENDKNLVELMPTNVIEAVKSGTFKDVLNSLYKSNVMTLIENIESAPLGETAIVLKPTISNHMLGKVPMAMVRIDANGNYRSARAAYDIVDLNREMRMAPEGTPETAMDDDGFTPMYAPYAPQLSDLNALIGKDLPKVPTKIKRDLQVYYQKQGFYVEDIEGLSEENLNKLGGSGDYVSLMSVDFKVDGNWEAQGSIPVTKTAMSKIYGSVIAGLRMALDKAKADGDYVDGIYFAGNFSSRDEQTRSGPPVRQKQRIYNALAKMPMFKEAFPELADMITASNKSILPNKNTLKDKAAAREAQEIRELEAQGELFDGDMMDDGFRIGGEASFRLNRVPELGNIEPSAKNDDIAMAIGLSPRERALSSLDILYNPELQIDVPEKDLIKQEDGQKRDAGRKVGEAGMGLQRKALEILGRPITKPNPETDELISKVMAAEVLGALRNNPENNAANWYTSSVEKAIDAVAQLYPEIRTDRTHRSAFSTALAITSQGIKVDRNSAIGLATYEFWRNNGRFPEYGEGKASVAMRKNFQTANALIDALGGMKPFVEFLDNQYTKKQLEEALIAAGIPTKGKGKVSLSGENVDAVLHGSFIFGPKIGQGFYQNLMGNFDPITIDMWLMRSWGRYTGTLMGKPAYQKNLVEMREAMIEEGIEFDQDRFMVDEQYTHDTVTRVAKMSEDFYQENRKAIEAKTMQKTEAMRKAENAVDNGQSTTDSPSGGTQRQWIRSVINRAKELVNEQQIRISNADLQAILWYPEKDLYEKIQKNNDRATNLNQSYEDSYGELINGETGLRTVDGGGRFDAVRVSVQEADRKSRKGTGKDATSEASKRFGRTDHRTDNMREVLADPDADSKTRYIYNSLAKYRDKAAWNKLGTQFIDSVVHGARAIGAREAELRQKQDGISRYKSFADGAFKIFEVAQQRSGRMEMFLEYGAPVLQDDGTITFDKSMGGLKQIFAPIGVGETYDKFAMYAYAKRAVRLKAEGREALFDESKIQEGLQYGAENPRFDRVLNNYNAFNERVMQFMVDTGSIDVETKEKLTGTLDYVPFYRIMEEEQYTEGLIGKAKVPQYRRAEYKGGTTAFDNPDAQIKSALTKLKGKDAKIGDLYQNIYRNVEALVTSGYQNLATQRVVRLMEEYKKEGLYSDKGDVREPRLISASEAKDNNNHFTFREDGKTKYYDVGDDGEMLQAMRTFTPVQMQGLFKGMQDVGRFFRNAITMEPTFMLANFIRGDMAGVVTVDAPLTPIVDSLRGLKNAFQDAETMQEMKTIGGFGGYTFGDSKDFSSRMQRFYRRHEGYTIVDTPQRLKDMFWNAVDAVNKAGENVEMSTREAIYRTMTEAGVDKGDAAFESLNLVNYSRRGNATGLAGQTISTLLPLVPFLNARIQGLYRTGSAFGKEATASKTIKKGLTLFGLSMAYYALSSQNEEWEKEPLHRRLNYYIFYIGDKKFLIPKPFEIGALFSTVPELLIDGVRQKDGDLVADGLTQTLLNTFSFNPIPQAVKPLVEVASNRDFFRGRELESLGVQGLPTEMRTYSNTSEFAKAVGKTTKYVGLSPIEVEQLIRGYTGSMSAYIFAGMDTAMGLTGAIPSKPSGVFGDSIPAKFASGVGLGRFVKDVGTDPANRFLSEFYEMKREADEVFRGINRLREEGNVEAYQNMVKKNGRLLAVRKNLNKKYKKLNEVSDAISAVRSSGKSPVEKKKEIDQLIRIRNRIVADMSQLKKIIRGD